MKEVVAGVEVGVAAARRVSDRCSDGGLGGVRPSGHVCVRVYAQCSNLGIDPVKQWGSERRGHVRDAL